MKICIDAGHGGKDSGAIGVNGRLEKNDVLTAALKFGGICRSEGHTVIMTRTGDTYPTLNERVNIANRADADVFISFHRNAFSDINANGGEILYAPNASKKSIQLAERGVKTVCNSFNFRNRGAKRQSATVLNNTNMPAVTVEMGFITNASDNQKYDNNLDKFLLLFIEDVELVIGGSSTPSKPEQPVNSLDYNININGEIWVQNVNDFNTCTLEAYPVYGDSGIFARVKLPDGSLALVEWSNLSKR